MSSSLLGASLTYRNLAVVFTVLSSVFASTTQASAVKVVKNSPAVISLPSFTQEPTSATVAGGQSATFVSSVSNGTGVSFQWFRNGSSIPGACSGTFIVPAVALSDNGASYFVTASNSAGTIRSATARLTVNARAAQTPSATRPFTDQSPWNARPTNFTLGTYQVPPSSYFPAVAEGQFSSGTFTSKATDPAITVVAATSAGMWMADEESRAKQVTIPHWPSDVTPASGSDGHADIIDPTTRIIHSFYQLRKVNGVWQASEYTWTALDGRGFGTPAQYMQGVRAAGVSPTAGLIRKAEINDGQPTYHHALAMSMTYNALAAKPAFVFPATTADATARTTNSGAIPEGARMMIPANFDTSVIKNSHLLKIVRTLQSYGAYVVDRNVGTPFFIYVELGSGFKLMPDGWDNEAAKELDIIRSVMRQVTSVSEWVDANGAPTTMETNVNLLSMRGLWYVKSGAAGTFNSYKQTVFFPDNGIQTTQINAGGRSIPSAATTSMAGKKYVLKVMATGGAQLKLDLKADATWNAKTIFTSGFMPNAWTKTFVWPADGSVPALTITSGPHGGGTVSATLTLAP